MTKNYIYAKVKRKQTLFRVIATNTDVYQTSNLMLTGVEYDPNTLIEDEELYQLSNFSQKNYAINFPLFAMDSVEYDQISRDDLKKLSYICVFQDDFTFFQVINSNYFISKKWFSIDELTLEVDKPIITINSFADAIYDRKKDVLYFKKLSVANRIFKGMDQLYREATDIETQSFLESAFLEVNVEFDRTKVTVPNRKRIALVKETLDKLNEDEKQAIYEYTNQYGKVTYSSGKFKIETDEDLKFVLWGIEQRFYTTAISGEKRIANSVIKI